MEPPKPSAYTPIARRFTDERARELEETRQLYAWVKARQDAFREDPKTIGRRVFSYFADAEPGIRRAFVLAMYDLIKGEGYLAELPPPMFDRMNLREFVEYRNLLAAKQYFFTNQAPLLQLLHEGLVRTLFGVARELPQAEDPSPFAIPLIYALPDPALMVEKTYRTFSEAQYLDRGLFRSVWDTLYRNLCEASGKNPDDGPGGRPFKHAAEIGLPLDQIVKKYLGGTTFHELFMTPVPLKLSHEVRFSHMHIVGGTGAGKSSLIETLILHDLQSAERPTIILIDPHTDLIRKLITADLGIEDRLVYISPRDTKHPPALNVFAVNKDRLARYDEGTREQVTAGVIETFTYLFSGLFGMELTGKQETFFRYVARLMLSLPETMGRNATILDMLYLMDDPTPYLPAIRALPPIQRNFFERDFLDKRQTTFKQTKEQIRYRLQAIIENPTLARLFTSQETKIDLFTEMNRGAVIVVDTAEDFLKKSGSSAFGQIFISLILQAVQERAAIPAHLRKHTFCYIDEASDFFSDNIDDLLTDARKFKAGLILSHQFLDQGTHALRASLAANTGTKFASRVSNADARHMAADMRTTAEFILNQPKLQFAAYIQDVTPQAVSIPVQYGALDRVPRLSDAAFEALLARNNERVSLPLGLPVFGDPPEPEPPKHTPYRPNKHAAGDFVARITPLKDEDTSDEW